MSAIDDFAAGMTDLGYAVTRRPDLPQFVLVQFEIPIGPQRGTVVGLGIEVPGDFPATPPPGIHVSPRIGALAGVEAVHASPLGDEWEYWSRPFGLWPQSSRTAKAYMAHARVQFEEL